MSRKGNILIFSTFLIAIIIIIFLFIIMVFVSEVNSLLYNIKLDMYSINKSAIISVNKGITSREQFSYDKEEYKEYLKDMLMKNYKLNENLESKDGIIQEAKILEYEIYSAGKKDGYTNLKLKDTAIHSVIEVKIKPIILASILEKYFIFEIHEDVVLNTIKT